MSKQLFIIKDLREMCIPCVFQFPLACFGQGAILTMVSFSADEDSKEKGHG